jgi:hypothetical protein
MKRRPGARGPALLAAICLLAACAAPRLAEWPETVDAAQCATALGTELDAMADACEHWPAMWRHAAEQGEGLLASVD